jgi:hypothetical protein
MLYPLLDVMAWRFRADECLHSRCQAMQNGVAEPFHRVHRVQRRTMNSRPQGRKLAFFVNIGTGNDYPTSALCWRD